MSMTALAGTIPIQIGDLKSNIEVVRRVPRVRGSIDATAIEAVWNERTIRVIDPISLLSAKLELVATVSQEKRRDATHLRILVPCVRAFLHEFLQQVELGHIPTAHWLGAVTRVLKLTTNRRAIRITDAHGIDWVEILPRTAILRSPHLKIRRFRENQLVRLFP